MVDHRTSSREDRAASSNLKNLSSPFLHLGDELVLKPLFLNEFSDRFARDRDVVDARVLGERVIAEDVDSLNLILFAVSFLDDLT
jgi:hypothetical protein